MADIFIAGIGRPPPRKFDDQLKESEKQLNRLRQYRPKFEKYEIVDTKLLVSITVDKNPVFDTLKREIESFNKQVREAIAENNEIINYSWKATLFQGLRNLLRSICNTHEPELQAKLLEKANEWYHDQIQRKEGGQSRDASPITRSHSAMSRVSKDEGKTQEKIQLKQVMQGPEPLPSVFKEKILKDYEEGARSKNDGALPPYDKIKIFDRHLPNEHVKPTSRQSTRASSTRNTMRPAIPVEMYQGVKQTIVPFKLKELGFKPTLPDQPAQQGTEEQKLGEEEAKPADEDADDGEKEEGEGDAAADEGEKIIVKKTFGSDLLTGYVQKVRNQQLPMEDRSTYVYFAPDAELYEKQLEKRWRDYQHNRINVKREKEEIGAFMDQWAHAKGRLDDEISRKNESMRHISQFQRRAFLPRPRTASLIANTSFKIPDRGRERTETPDRNNLSAIEKYVPNGRVDLGDDDDDRTEVLNKTDIDIRQKTDVTVYRERPVSTEGKGLFDYAKQSPLNFKTGQQIDRKRPMSIEEQVQRRNVQNFRMFYGGLIGAKEAVTVDRAAGRSVSPSLSVYESRVDPKRRPFSGILDDSMEVRRDLQIEESDEVKKKLARFKINVPLTTVTKSIVVPDLIPKSDLLSIPSMGSRLLENPFAKKKKKKKGGKKKK